MPSDYDPQDWQKGDTLEAEQATALSHQLAEEEQINEDQNAAIAGIQADFAELLTKALTSYANGTPFPFKVNVLTEEQFDEIEVKDPDTLYVRPGGLDALQAASNLSDLLDAAAARANLGLGTAAVEDVSTLQTVIVAAITDSSPSTLDTLNELAAALGDDPNFAATMTAALAGKVGTGDSRLTDTRTPTDGTVTTAKFTGAALVTSLEGLASSNNDTSLPTVKAAKDYIDTAVAGVGGGGVGNGLLSARPSAATAGCRGPVLRHQHRHSLPKRRHELDADPHRRYCCR